MNPFAARLHAVTAGDPRALALADRDQRITYGELLADAQARAAALRAAGVLPGDRVALLAEDGADAVRALLATLLADAVHVPIDTQLTAVEREAALASTAAQWLVAGGQPPRRLRPAAPDPLHALGGSAFLRHTSGTTGAARGVLLSQPALAARAAAAAAALGLAPGERMLWLLPLAYHVAASVLAALSAGAAVVFANRLRIADTLAEARAHGATLAYASPWHARRLAQAADLAGLRQVVVTTAALDGETLAALRQRVRVRQALGIIEVGLPLVSPGAPDELPGDVGRPAPGFSATVVPGPGDAPDEGELHLAGPGLFDAYADPWRPAAQVLTTDGRFATGDRARLAADGAVRLLGRLKDLINVGGSKVFPAEVEAVLTAHPQVAACRVRGAPDPRTGERVVAEVVAHDPAWDPRELDAWCAARLAPLKRPAEIHLLAHLPLTASGKVKRA